MGKLLVIGIDGMEPRLVQHWLPQLPNMAALAQGGVIQPIASVFPADSLPAWTTIYTGQHPAEHGLIETIDYLTTTGLDAGQPTRFAGQTFWDEASRRGKRVCVVNAFMAYPVWPVNGVMVSGPVFVTGAAQSHPDGILAEHPPAELGGMVDYPYRWGLGRFAQRATRAARDQHALAASLMRSTEWDLFFLCLLTLDRAQHFFWRFCDATDPAYPGPNPFQSAVFRHYQLMDEIVGSLSAQADDAEVMVLSDHGHGQRPSCLFHLNEWLRQEGWLACPESNHSGWNASKAVEQAKSVAFSVATRLALEDVLYAAARLIPEKRRASLKESSYAVDRERSRAYAGKLGGSSGAGGIVLADASAELRDEIAQGLMLVTDPATDERVVEWVKPREAVLPNSGGASAHAHAIPDMLFRLRPGYGISRAVYGPLFSTSPTHRRVSGGHTGEGILAASRGVAARPPAALHEVYDSILRALSA